MNLSLIFVTVYLFKSNMLPLEGEIQKAKPKGKEAEGEKCSHILCGFSVRMLSADFPPSMREREALIVKLLWK